MKNIKNMTREKADELHTKMQSEAQAKFISWVAKEEKVDWSEALRRCTESEGPENAELRVGYKLADPIIQMDIWMRGTKKGREEAAARFAATLDEWELERWKEVDQQGAIKLLKSSLKRKSKTL